jgi:hypothetical protein
VRPILVRGFLAPATLAEFCARVEEIKTQESLSYDEMFQRHYINGHAYFQKILHRMMLKIAVDTFKEELVASYSFLSFYQEGRGVCPAHRDRPECYRTIDICLRQRRPWALFVDGEEFLMEPGDAIFYAGSEQLHWRDVISEGNYCDLLFFHFSRGI